MKIQKSELGEIVVDQKRSFDIAQVHGRIHATLYKDPINLGVDEEGNEKGFELDCFDFVCYKTTEITEDSIRVKLGDPDGFDTCVTIATEQEEREKARKASYEAEKRLERLDYRKLKFVCSLIDLLADDGTLSQMRQLAKDFLAEYPKETVYTDNLRKEKRTADKALRSGEYLLPF